MQPPTPDDTTDPGLWLGRGIADGAALDAARAGWQELVDAAYPPARRPLWRRAGSLAKRALRWGRHRLVLLRERRS